MTVPKREEEQPASKAAIPCPTCASKNVIARLGHHWGKIDRPSDAVPDMSRLAEHLTEVYGLEYAESGKLKNRLEFVLTVWIIWRDELKDGKTQYSMSEAYNLAATRLHWQKRPEGLAPIDRSQPSGDR